VVNVHVTVPPFPPTTPEGKPEAVELTYVRFGSSIKVTVEVVAVPRLPVFCKLKEYVTGAPGIRLAFVVTVLCVAVKRSLAF